MLLPCNYHVSCEAQACICFCSALHCFALEPWRCSLVQDPEGLLAREEELTLVVPTLFETIQAMEGPISPEAELGALFACAGPRGAC